MTTGYLITTVSLEDDVNIEEVESKFDQEQLLELLAKDWTVRNITGVSAGYSCRWELIADGYVILGGLQKHQQAVSIDVGNIDSVADFAMWLRSVVDSHQRLYMYVSSLNRTSLELTGDTTKEMIVEHFS